jgi:gliding motility-associated-like protein
MIRKILLIAALLSLVCKCVYAQGEENIWTFGQYYAVDFNTSPPTVLDKISNPNYKLPTAVDNEASIVVCDAQGNRLFSVRKSRAVNSSVNDIYDKNDDPILNTALLTNSGTMRTEQTPMIIPHPGNSNQYYIVYGRNGGLLYSLFDLTLNNGLGNVVSGKHNILFAGYNTVFAPAMTTIQGCDGVWIVVRTRINNTYQSYKVDQSGLNPVPVQSEATLLPLNEFKFVGYLRASPDGKMLAATVPQLMDYSAGPQGTFIPGALIVYDFEPCSGRLVNERILDWNNSFEGICFSPDNSKLYVTQNDTVFFSQSNMISRLGKVFQYDFSLPTWTGIQNSKTLILTNPLAWYETPIGCMPFEIMLGDLKRGPDGKIYLLNNYGTVCLFGVGLAFHIIHEPNNAGMLCNPEIDGLYHVLNGMTNHQSIENIIPLPRDIVFTPKMLPDTITGNVQVINICFDDSTILIAKAGICYEWNTGSTDSAISINKDGVYWVQYFEDCRIIVDTYLVTFTPLPSVKTLQHGCPGDMSIEIDNRYGYNCKLYKENAALIGNWGNDTIRIYGMDEGKYRLEMSTPNGCDTVLEINLLAYPIPEINIFPKDTTIRYGEYIRLHADGGILYAWQPVAPLDSANVASPLAKLTAPTTFTVTVWNEYGCKDTAQVHIGIDYTTTEWLPNAFTPNGDGLNDVFRIAGLRDQKVSVFEVYNRFGEQVHAEHYSNNGWEGTYKGKLCDMGTYFYFVVLQNPDGSARQLKGEVHLIR